MLQFLIGQIKYIVFLIVFFSLTIPWIIKERDYLLTKITLLFYPIEYNPTVLNKYRKKAKNIIEKNSIDLKMMKNVCEHFYLKSQVDEIFYSPTWTEKKDLWTVEKIQKKDFRTNINLEVDPGEYWNEKIEFTLVALDYLKRALNYSGPNYELIKELEEVALASCRPAEIVIAYIFYIQNSEDFILQKLSKNNFIPKGLREKQIKTIVWSTIKSNKKSEVNIEEYKEGLLSLILLTKLDKISPNDGLEVYEKLIFISSSNEWEKNKIHYRRGLLYYKLSDKNKDFLKNAILDFESSTIYSNPTQYKGIFNEEIAIQNFQSNLMIAKSFSKWKQNQVALEILKKINEQVPVLLQYKIEERIILDFKETFRKVLRELGMFEMADEIE